MQEAARVECKMLESACEACGDGELSSEPCVKNGWRQRVRCIEARAAENQSYIEASSESYLTYQPCQLAFGGFVKLELLMMLCFALSFVYVKRRQRRLQKIQQWRIASY